jgi:hypothetical protein
MKSGILGQSQGIPTGGTFHQRSMDLEGFQAALAVACSTGSDEAAEQALNSVLKTDVGAFLSCLFMTLSQAVDSTAQ